MQADLGQVSQIPLNQMIMYLVLVVRVHSRRQREIT